MNPQDPPIVETPIGLRLIAPDNNDISLIEDQSHIERMARRHGLREVIVGAVSMQEIQVYGQLVSLC